MAWQWRQVKYPALGRAFGRSCAAAESADFDVAATGRIRPFWRLPQASPPICPIPASQAAVLHVNATLASAGSASTHPPPPYLALPHLCLYPIKVTRRRFGTGAATGSPSISTPAQSMTLYPSAVLSEERCATARTPRGQQVQCRNVMSSPRSLSISAPVPNRRFAASVVNARVAACRAPETGNRRAGRLSISTYIHMHTHVSRHAYMCMHVSRHACVRACAGTAARLEACMDQGGPLEGDARVQYPCMHASMHACIHP